MHIAIKYSMNDVQDAITKVIQTPPRPPGTEFPRLAFAAEFPSHFSKALAIQLFINASSITYFPTVNDVPPFAAHTAILALLMQYREGFGNSDVAPWDQYRSCSRQDWLSKKFESLGFKP